MSEETDSSSGVLKHLISEGNVYISADSLYTWLSGTVETYDKLAERIMIESDEKAGSTTDALFQSARLLENSTAIFSIAEVIKLYQSHIRMQTINEMEIFTNE